MIILFFQETLLKNKSEGSRRRFYRQRNFCVSLLRKTKIRFFGKLDHRVVSDKSKFWKTVGPFLSEKAFHKESIILNNNNKTISNNEELAEIFDKHFSKLVENLDIDETLASDIANSDITDPVFSYLFIYLLKLYLSLVLKNSFR